MAYGKGDYGVRQRRLWRTAKETMAYGIGQRTLLRHNVNETMA